MKNLDNGIKLPVHFRGGFSDRNRINKENNQIQYKNLDDRTRTALINITNIIYNKLYVPDLEREQKFLRSILRDVYVQEVDSNSRYIRERVFEVINATIRDDSYDSVFSLLEYLVNLFNNETLENIEKSYNRIFENEFVGYRFINGQIRPITDENEINAIDEATSSKHKAVNEHLKKALNHLSDRNNPDYENSIKESISAVEAMCSIILNAKDTLGAALKKLKGQGLTVHPSMEEAFKKLYGYTSDANGIRHAGNLDGPTATFEEAKFMLVSCSAFINYLVAESANYGILIK